MEEQDFSKFKLYQKNILDKEAKEDSYFAIIRYVELLKLEGKSTGYLDRFYLVMKEEVNKDLDFFKKERIYFINILDDMEIILSGYFS